MYSGAPPRSINEILRGFFTQELYYYNFMKIAIPNRILVRNLQFINNCLTIYSKESRCPLTSSLKFPTSILLLQRINSFWIIK